MREFFKGWRRKAELVIATVGVLVLVPCVVVDLGTRLFYPRFCCYLPIEHEWTQEDSDARDRAELEFGAQKRINEAIRRLRESDADSHIPNPDSLEAAKAGLD